MARMLGAMTTAALAAASVADQMPVAQLKDGFVNQGGVQPAGNATDVYVFLQRFPLGGVDLFYHTEVIVCPKTEFSKDDQTTLDGQIAGLKDFADVAVSWWSARNASCVELGYGGNDCSTECCGVPHGDSQTKYPLNARRAVIGNANVKEKMMYIYGTGKFDGNTAYHYTCDKKCWSDWSGTNYNPITNNCNTFTSTVLNSVYNLSEHKPNLGPSDLVHVTGHCPAAEPEPHRMPVAQLKKRYEENGSPAGGPHDVYVFLQRFPLEGVEVFYHTEVLACPVSGFTAQDKTKLDGMLADSKFKDFTEIEKEMWTTLTANCVELGYGGSDCTTECCGVPLGRDQTEYPLNARRAVIGNADVSNKRVFIYGKSSFGGVEAWHRTCDAKCWSMWTGTDYNPVENNCNTFTSTVLHNVYNLSEQKPSLGVSDLVHVTGHCPANLNEVIV